MELREAFEAVMMGTENMALATCTGDKPNVRVVTFGYEKQNPKTVYFTTFQGNQKIAEFEQNPNVTLNLAQLHWLSLNRKGIFALYEKVCTTRHSIHRFWSADKFADKPCGQKHTDPNISKSSGNHQINI